MKVLPQLFTPSLKLGWTGLISRELSSVPFLASHYGFPPPRSVSRRYRPSSDHKGLLARFFFLPPTPDSFFPPYKSQGSFFCFFLAGVFPKLLPPPTWSSQHQGPTFWCPPGLALILFSPPLMSCPSLSPFNFSGG